MPRHSTAARYDHHRREPPGHFKPGIFPGSTQKFATRDLHDPRVPVYCGEKYDVPGAKKVVGMLKKKYGDKAVIQTILTPRVTKE